uniref:Ensconsin-like n=1 Tax=Gasterosteus aculeatus aculeatus TaxID=481459 RepID=G3PC54_GASAC
MPGSKPSMAVQDKHSDVPPSQGPLSARIINSQSKRNGFNKRTGDNCGYIKPNCQANKTACSVNTASQICNTATSRAAAVTNGPNVDERLKAARVRREEHQKLLACRERGRLEREQRARQYYDQQLQERKKKLLDQRLKEERRRAAVAGKRKQTLKEEKERYESAVRRTVEKSQRAQHSLSHNPRGRKLTKSVSCHSMNSTVTAPHNPKHPSGSFHHMPSASPSPHNRRHRSVNMPQMKAARQKDAHWKDSNTKSPPANTSANTAKVKPPSPERTPRRSIRTHSTPLQPELPPVPEEDVTVCSSALSPGNSRPARTPVQGQRKTMMDENAPGTPCLNLPHKETPALTATTGHGSPPQTSPRPDPQPPKVTCRPSAGTTDQEEASRLLAEKRREARLQREREEQERLQREEADRRSREELEHMRAGERARQQAEARRLIEEKMRREGEEQRQAEEERAQARREAALLQKQREEEQAKERAKAEEIIQEREILAQKEDAARQARKKRLEEIMRRTRRTDSPDTKTVPASVLPSEARPKENTEPIHNGSIEVAVKLTVGTKTSQLNNEEDVIPVVAFKERRSLRTLTGLEEIQSHQRAEVI